MGGGKGEKYREKKIVGCLKAFCWSHRELQEQQWHRDHGWLGLSWAHSYFFQEADRKHLGPRAGNSGGSRPHPMQHIISSTRRILCRFHSSKQHSLAAHKQTYLRCTRHRGVCSFILLQPRGTENSKENCKWWNCWL